MTEPSTMFRRYWPSRGEGLGPGPVELSPMRAGVARVLFDNDVPPLGDVTLAPSGMTGMSEALLARAMAEQVLANRFETEEDALKPVRRAFADSPLAFRVGALAALMRRR